MIIKVARIFPHNGWGHIIRVFSLIQPFVIELTQLAQFGKTSDACQYMKLLNVRSTGNTEGSVAYLVEHQIYILRVWVPSSEMFYSVAITFG